MDFNSFPINYYTKHMVSFKTHSSEIVKLQASRCELAREHSERSVSKYRKEKNENCMKLLSQKERNKHRKVESKR
jgi:hypothetical protein